MYNYFDSQIYDFFVTYRNIQPIFSYNIFQQFQYSINNILIISILHRNIRLNIIGKFFLQEQ